ncbi:MAG: hypothetical protein IPI44_24005 [Sulfuritalea sp.]|nr:hypothetical protein [Sulfuritalea sp.]
MNGIGIVADAYMAKDGPNSLRQSGRRAEMSTVTPFAVDVRVQAMPIGALMVTTGSRCRRHR